MTPERYKNAGYGIDISDVTDQELAAHLDRAADIVHGYCTVPKHPVSFSFLGGEIPTTNYEQHAWGSSNYQFDPARRRVFPLYWPIKAVTELRIKVTNTQYVSFDAADLFVNNEGRYIEIISAAYTSVGLFGAILPWTAGLMTPIAELAYTYGWEFIVVGEKVYSDDNKTYYAVQQFWKTGTAKVYKNGSEETTGFTVDEIEGKVVFDSALQPTDIVTVDYTYLLPSEIKSAMGIITTHLLGERETQARGMESIDTLKVAEVTIKKSEPKITSQNLTYFSPEAAWYLDGFKFWTLR